MRKSEEQRSVTNLVKLNSNNEGKKILQFLKRVKVVINNSLFSKYEEPKISQ